MVGKEGGFNADDTDWTNLYDLVEPQSRSNSPQKFSAGFPGKEDDEGKVEGRGAFDKQDGLKVFPLSSLLWRLALKLLAVAWKTK